MTALSLSPDPDAAIVVRARMRQISEALYYAGWLDGLEYALWSMFDVGSDRRFGVGEVAERDVADLVRLSTRAGGWWRFDDDLGDQVFVTLPEWRRLYAERTAGVDDVREEGTGHE